jgi:hypothetical protein
LVGNIPMHKDLSWQKPTDLICGYSGIRTPNPEIFWTLDIHQRLKIVRILFQHGLGPNFVVFHYLCKFIDTRSWALEIGSDAFRLRLFLVLNMLWVGCGAGARFNNWSIGVVPPS